MPEVDVGGATLAYAERGSGPPVVFLHEFAGSMAAWSEQIDDLADDYRTVVYNCRGYPPSSAPSDIAGYSQASAVEDLRGLMDTLSIGRAALVGLSMGGTTALNFAIRYPQRVSCMVIASAGSGSDDKPAFIADFGALADLLEREGSAAFAERYLRGPTRLQLLRKRPGVWSELRDRLAAMPPGNLARTIRGVMLRRPAVYELEAALRGLSVPALIMVGDEDAPVLRAAGFLTASLRRSDLMVLRDTGHTLNLEEPAAFNAAIRRLIAETRLLTDRSKK
jgi:pimeloyl-ACP methyl ester carboxylesterase